MTIPQLLSIHIQELTTKGYKITTKVEGTEIYILFENYIIPLEIWSRDRIELMVKTSFAYPQAKMDMFWVKPHILLKSGNKPQSAEVYEHHLGDEWQRFSWHPSKWNPGHDNLITFLDFINHRLYQDR